MTNKLLHSGNILGDIRAEADKKMLEAAFYETADYRSLIECSDRTLVVGRRGTGKSALVYQLSRHMLQDPSIRVISIAPSEDEMLGVRASATGLGDKFKLIRAGLRIVFRHALYMEMLRDLSKTYSYRFKKHANHDSVKLKLHEWQMAGKSFAGRVAAVLVMVTLGAESPEAIISKISSRLGLDEVEAFVRELLDSLEINFRILIDNLDEGYEPDSTGVAIVDGCVHAAIDVNSRINRIIALSFVRDNIFRAVAQLDPDYTRTLEGQELRLHWDERQLFSLTCKRLRVAFSLDIENDVKLWNRCVARQLENFDGFKEILRLTLYRPRDVLALLNKAYYAAKRKDQDQIVLDDVQSVAQEISEARLNDLVTEYGDIVPGLQQLIYGFRDRSQRMSYDQAIDVVRDVVLEDSYEPNVQQSFRIIETPVEALNVLYSIGFVGVKSAASESFSFCHDGRKLMPSVEATRELLVHPCYWIALGMKKEILSFSAAQSIDDDGPSDAETPILVESSIPEIRSHRIGQLLTQLSSISQGKEGATDFENWCHDSLSIAFAGHLRNFELHPNKAATSRRDVVATNNATQGVWRHIYEDYGSRQTLFEIKNYAELAAADFAQINNYLSGMYGRFGIFVTRREDDNPTGAELQQIREVFDKHQKLVVILSCKTLCRILSKIRNPKRDFAEMAMHKLLDDYVRLYVVGQGKGKVRKRRR